MLHHADQVTVVSFTNVCEFRLSPDEVLDATAGGSTSSGRSSALDQVLAIVPSQVPTVACSSSSALNQWVVTAFVSV